MDYQNVPVDCEGDVVTITMNRPQRRGALPLDHLREQCRALQELGNATSAGIVLAGNVRVLSADQDFADVADADLDAMTSQTPPAREGVAAFLEKRKPQWPDRAQP